MTPPRAMTLAEVAERLGVALATIRREVADKRLIPERYRGCVRVSEEELARYRRACGARDIDSAPGIAASLKGYVHAHQVRHARS